MRLGPNIQRVGAWVLAFVVAQGMVYQWGYEVGYLSGHRQGYGDFFEEGHSKACSEEAIRVDAANAGARPLVGGAVAAARELPGS